MDMKKPLSLYNVTLEDGSTTELAEIKRVGITSKMVDPKDTEKTYKIPIDKREKIREFSVQWDNYLDPLRKYNFLLYFKNSIFVTVYCYNNNTHNKFDGSLCSFHL